SVGLVMLRALRGWWGYFVLFGLLWNGPGPGEGLLGVRGGRADGQALAASTSLVRNLLRAVDVFLLIGVVVMLIDRSSRRLGDFAAGSLVVREPRGLAADALSPLDLPDISPDQVLGFPNAGALTMQHYILIRDSF